jgi:hypothetical protein
MERRQLSKSAHDDERQQENKSQQTAKKAYPEYPYPTGYFFGEVLLCSQGVKVLSINVKGPELLSVPRRPLYAFR